ncbi:MAG TPA: FAD-dependent oxidoreductase [Bacillota bacterium]|jgi:NADPH-dependent 2,4-dienoyl-CoA reductase/sulfur reductase-like enzyme/Fe-S-cluster-containing hydrogenase component 2
MSVADIIVIGGGPAGLSAATAAASHGARVVVVDEQSVPGGQLSKQIHKFFGSREHWAGTRGLVIGRRLLAEAQAAGVEVRLGQAAYAVYPDTGGGFEVGVYGGEGRATGGRATRLRGRRLIVATGASENPLAFPGWTLPGVMGAGAVQTLVNVHRVRPGKRALMVGSGNVGLIVSYQLLQAGVDVVAVVEAMPRIGGFLVHAGKVKRAGIPILLGHTVVEATGDGRVERAVVARLGEGGQVVTGSERGYDVDTVCLAVGLSPLLELLLLLGVRTDYIPALGGHVPLHDRDQQTSVPGVYAAGDLAGVEEASVAMEEGRLAGLAAAESLGRGSGTAPAALAAAKREVIARLDGLRGGPFGMARREAKARQVAGLSGPAGGADVATAAPPPLSPAVSAVPAVGIPGRDRPVAVIQCPQEIPCNPCETACPRGAITVGTPITNRPTLDVEACTGCGLCLTACPGQAIFLIGRSGDEAKVTFPYEYLPLPEVGQTVTAVDAEGRPLVEARVASIRLTKQADRTCAVTLAVPNEYAGVVRGMLRPGR